MVDTHTPKQRSDNMRNIKGGNTKPELAVRRLIHNLGYRYRLHAKNLPGRPDIIFTKKKKIIYVHGCYWHQHVGCPKTRVPKSRLEYWVPKLERNKQRDAEIQKKLKELGWDVLIIWECEIKDIPELTRKIEAFL